MSNIEQNENEHNVEKFIRLSGNLLTVCSRYKTTPFSLSGRGSVVGFSAGSAVRMRRYLRECVTDYRHMVTLTYPFCYESDGKRVKEHLRRFCQQWLRKCKRDSLVNESMFWFLEFQSRGAPHFHIFTVHGLDYKWVARTWYDICNTEDPRHLDAGTRVEKLKRGRSGLISYASKYANKPEQKTVPDDYENVGRFWGVYGCRAVVAAATAISPKVAMCPVISHYLEVMNKAIKAAIDAKKARVICRKQGVVVVVIDDKNTRALVGMNIAKINVRRILEHPMPSDAYFGRMVEIIESELDERRFDIC